MTSDGHESEKSLLKALLAEIPSFRDLPEIEHDLLADQFKKKSVSMGSVIFREGDPPGSLYVVRSGLVRATASCVSGEEITLVTLGPGSLFGEITVLRGTPRTATVRAAEQTELLELPAEACLALFARHPRLKDQFELNLPVYELRLQIRTSSILRLIPAPRFNRILPQFETVRVSKGENVVSAGEIGDRFFVVIAGRLEILSEDKKVNVIGPGEQFGEIALVTGRPRTETVRAMDDAVLLALNRDLFDGVMAECEPFREEIGRLIKTHLSSDALGRSLGDVSEPPPFITPESDASIEGEEEDETTTGEEGLPPAVVADESAATPRGRRFFRRFPFVAQQDETDCGAACLAMIALQYGKRLSLSRLRDLVNVTTEGASMASLSVAGESLGFATRGLRTTMARLPTVTLPAVLHWQGNHFVVLWKVTSRHAVIGDPALGRKKVRLEEVDLAWNGYLIEFHPTAALEDVKPAWTSMARFMPLLANYRLALFEIFLCSFLLNLFGLAQPLFTQVVVDKVFVHESVNLLNAMMVGMVVVAMLSAFTGGLRRFMLVYISTRIDLRLITDFVRHLLKLPTRYFDVRKVGDVMARVDENESITKAFVGTIPTAILDFLMAIIYIAIMSLYSVKMTMIVLVCVIPFAILTLGFTPIIRANRRELFARYAISSSFLIENITGIHTVKSQAVETPMRWKWESMYHRVLLETRRGAHIDIVQETLARFFSTLTTTFLFWYGARLVLGGSLSLGQLFAFNVLVGNVMTPMLGLVGLWDQLQAFRISLDRLNDVFDSPPEEDPSRTMIVLPRLAGHIRFENVVFGYKPERESRPILNRISFEIQAGTTCAIVGRSGAGKSTIAKLILRFYTAKQGRVVIDEHDVRTLSAAHLRQSVGVVPQEVVLFAGSIRDNIALGDPEMPLEKVIEAAQGAGAHEFITSFPLAYDTVIGERGTDLSGGQRQRLAIARAILHKPAILILDEATSALDSDSERAIQKNLDTLCSDRTTIIIAHRLSTVQRAQKILVMDAGGVAESGTHQELLAKKGLYSYFIGQQLSS